MKILEMKSLRLEYRSANMNNEHTFFASKWKKNRVKLWYFNANQIQPEHFFPALTQVERAIE